MSLPDLRFLVWWVSGCVIVGTSCAYLYLVARWYLRRFTKDQVLRYIANKFHTLGWREDHGADIDAFFIEPRRGFGFARAMFLFLVAWRSYLQQDKTLLMLVIDHVTELFSQCGYHRHAHDSGLWVLSAKHTWTGSVARWVNHYLVPFRWWLDDRQLQKRRK